MPLPVDAERLWRSLMDMGELGALPLGGCCRTALSPADKAGRDLFVRWCREAGCEVVIDQIGNIYARRPGRDNDRPAAATGSHLDTQPHGGKFDGIYGVLAGLEVVRALNDGGVETAAPLDVIVWTNEEGVRFSPPLAGSSVAAGKFSLPFVHAAVTLDGTTVKEDLEAIGYLGRPPWVCISMNPGTTTPSLASTMRSAVRAGSVSATSTMRFPRITMSTLRRNSSLTPSNIAPARTNVVPVRCSRAHVRSTGISSMWPFCSHARRRRSDAM